ncbi:hypothetical protein RvVAT039_04260 [Agrobacterium vitis]|uniref:Uncharacterized protein n=1 Tax=Agrobacterium vitis TaxID=373 RepID=A0ABD6H9E3_AGRVI|nr:MULTISPECIES: hypothetical protein [Rhizobium/Agrobacterium group]MUO29998.1 hypothetical protein [Agrobacterium vitis]MUO42362.1 hypothetical protein [Agrobacterium vitis]MUP10724.1 hypothetical protein [Agrobacterium vitis]BCH63210.1 hypothetical protein RvVAT039_04260 [Agrobacterium vitis]
MFKIVPTLTAWWPVSVLEPDNDNPGKLKEFTFEAEFVIRGKEQMKPHDDKRAELLKQLPTAEEFAANYQAASEKAEATKALIEAHDRNMFHLMITNWRGVFDADDQALSFSADNLNMALGFDRIRVGLNRAYEEAVSNDKARLGNSKGLH